MSATPTTFPAGDDIARAWWNGVADGRIGYQVCADCGAVQFYPRSHCTACGSARCETRASKGAGAIFSITVVHRPPSEALRAHAPYAIALVDLDEGFRMMAHADPGCAIGDRVTAAFIPFGDRVVPRFARA
ncbi:MAG: Zn-ribbon domain-containing OB-fold protein [Rhodospirillales bacterium]|nr:MAG: Zn-ribbon domain-containing OB-fold protein [Rhodospirillales bacterium]